MRMTCVLAGVLLGVSLCLSATAESTTPLPRAGADPRSPEFLARGVYWAGEFVWRTKERTIDWDRVETALDDLAKRHVNTIWLTHVSAADGAKFSRRAAARGIFLVASLSELAGEVEHIRKGDHKALIEGVLKAWGDAPKPIAWGLGDEPRTGYMPQMAAYVADWRKYAPGEPVTTVVMHQDKAAAGKAGFDMLSTDIYPFFSSGNPHGFGMPPFAAWTVHARHLAALTARPWMMGQCYQDPWGPFEMDEKANIVYLPGGAPHWVMPTPAQIRWQTLATFALGCRGIIYFHYRAVINAKPAAAPAKLPAAAKEKTNSGAPTTLVYPDGSPTPQIEAMGDAFEWVARRAPIIEPLRATEFIEAWETAPIKHGGNVVGMFANPQSKARYLMLVASYDLPAGEAVRFTVGPHVTGIKDAVSGEAVSLTLAAPFRTGEVKLAPGSAALLECAVDPENLPAGYADDFMTDKFRADAIAVRNVRRHGDQVLSAAGQEDAAKAFVVYDLQKWIPATAEGGVQMLTYEGRAIPADFRGAFWFSSPDNTVWEKLSANEFGKQVFFKDRYLKVCLSWKQSSAAWAYGCLSRFTIVQWKRAAAR